MPAESTVTTRSGLIIVRLDTPSGLGLREYESLFDGVIELVRVSLSISQPPRGSTRPIRLRFADTPLDEDRDGDDDLRAYFRREQHQIEVARVRYASPLEVALAVLGLSYGLVKAAGAISQMIIHHGAERAETLANAEKLSAEADKLRMETRLLDLTGTLMLEDRVAEFQLLEREAEARANEARLEYQAYRKEIVEGAGEIDEAMYPEAADVLRTSEQIRKLARLAEFEALIRVERPGADPPES